MESEFELINVTNVTTTILPEQETTQESAQKIFQEPANVVIVILSITGFVANVLTIMATGYIPGRQTTHSKLIISLSTADICITMSVIFHVLVKEIRPLYLNDCVNVANDSFFCFSLLASLINLLAMGIDHYVAVLKPLHYHLIMSPIRTNVMLVTIWIISITGGFLEIVIGGYIFSDNGKDFCKQVLSDSFDAQLPILCLVLLEMIILMYLYCHIFYQIKSSSYEAQLCAQSLLRRQSNSNLHNKKAIITTVLIVGTFMITWIPYSVFHVGGVIIIEYYSREALMEYLDVLIKVNNILWILVQCNCIFDPLIYAVRIPAVRQGYRQMIKKLKFCHILENTNPTTGNYSYRRVQGLRHQVVILFSGINY